MNGIAAIQRTLDSTRKVTLRLLSDFSDAEMLVRPFPNANHAAWQIGNVIGADVFLGGQEVPAVEFPKLPDGFGELHDKSGAGKDEGFLTRDDYVTLFNAARDASIKAVGTLTEADLDRPAHEAIRQFLPTVGDVFLLLAEHTLMHGGQFSVIRRKLGKPVLL